MPKSKRAVESALQSKGFRLDTEGDHRYFTYHRPDGTCTAIYTKTSHGRGGRDLSEDLLGKMARQCRLRRRDFDRLVDCDLDRPGYDAMMEDQGEL